MVAVQDANILIDFAQLGLLELVMRLPYAFQTTDLIQAESIDRRSIGPVQACISSGKLLVKSFSADELTALEAMAAEHRSLSLEDCSAWKLAKDAKGMLLTGDGALRKKVTADGIEVHGSLWLLKALVAHEKIDKATACTKLQELQRLNDRLPIKAIQQLQQQWCTPIKRLI